MFFEQSSSSILAVKVQKFPCLWKISDENFGNFAKCEEAWEEICGSIGIYKKETVLELKKSWRGETNEFRWVYLTGNIDWDRWTPYLYLVQSVNWDEYHLNSMKLAMVAIQMIEGKPFKPIKKVSFSSEVIIQTYEVRKKKHSFPFLKKCEVA